MALWLAFIHSIDAFTAIPSLQQSRRSSLSKAAPKRLEENVDGVLYVNDRVRPFYS